MQQSHGTMLVTLENARALLRANAAALGDTIPEAALARLDSAISGLAENANTQNGHLRAAAGSLNLQRVKREALLRDHMAPIAKIAALELEHVPRIIALTLPRKHVTLKQLATLANGMAEAAAPFAQVFISAGRKPQFLDQMRTAASEMLAAAADRAQNRYRVKQVGTDLRTRLSRGRKVIHMLDALVKSAAATNPGLLDAWKMAKRVPKKAASAPAAATPGAATTTAPTSVAA